MRTPYIPPSSKEFDLIFLNRERLIGGGIGDIKSFSSPVYHQRGSNLFSFIGRMAQKTIPFLKKYLLPIAGDMISGLSHDVSNDKNLKESFKRRGADSIKNLTERVYKGRGKKKIKSKVKKRKRKIKLTLKEPRKRKCNSTDVFNI